MTERPLRVGTAGWSVPSRYAAEVPAGGSHLERYARRLNAVEINSSFYRSHQRKTYERWAWSTPDDFRFSVKMPKAITHAHGLKKWGALLDAFAAEVTGLGDKLAVLFARGGRPRTNTRSGYAGRLGQTGRYLRSLHITQPAPVGDTEQHHEAERDNRQH